MLSQSTTEDCCIELEGDVNIICPPQVSCRRIQVYCDLLRATQCAIRLTQEEIKTHGSRKWNPVCKGLFTSAPDNEEGTTIMHSIPLETRKKNDVF